MNISAKMTTTFWIIGAIIIFWTALTFLAQRKSVAETTLFGLASSPRKALIVYNPDLFYNLDEQVCKSFAKSLTENGWQSKVTTVTAAENLENELFDLYVFCANTYNWAPDWPTRNFIEKHDFLKGKNVIAITLGSGSTQRSQRLLVATIEKRKAKLLHSEVYWLMRPNDSIRADEPNVQIALEKAESLGKWAAQLIK